MNLSLLSIKGFVWGMLLVFAISVTPKQYFHDLLSDHEDELFAQPASGTEHISTYHFNCGFVNVVATSPFLKPCAEIYFHENPFTVDFISALGSFLPSHSIRQFLLRGPPTA